MSCDCHQQDQGPADRCVIDGKALGWLSCTAYSAAMVLDAATCGRVQISGCTVRKRTGDTVGGLMLSQVEPVIEAYGISVRRKTGSDYADAAYIADRLRKGHPAIFQGNAGVLIDTIYQSTAGWVNHAVAAPGKTQNWRIVNGLYRPDHVLIHDPAADGRLDFADGPQWWTWATLMRFTGALRPWGDSDSRVLGYGRAYAAFLTPEQPPTWRARVAPETRFWEYTLAGDYIMSRRKVTTEHGFSAYAEAPRQYRVHSTRRSRFPSASYVLGELLEPSSRAGKFIGRQYITEI